jgi:hypothetical protein
VHVHRTEAQLAIAGQISATEFRAPSTFGGVIPTPALDRIAKAGLPYTQFHSTADHCGTFREVSRLLTPLTPSIPATRMAARCTSSGEASTPASVTRPWSASTVSG